jgi:hypothetical protein
MLPRARALALAGTVLLAWAPAAGPERRVELVATGVPRPLQLAFDRDGALVVLSPGEDGASAGEIFRVAVRGELPVNLARAPRLRIPYPPGPRKAALGSLALEPTSGDLVLGEENGTRVYRIGGASMLRLHAIGLHRLGGGGTLAFDAEGRLLVVDYVDQIPPSLEEPALPGFEWLRDEDYRGPLVFRLALDPGLTLPRDLARAAPFFPRAWGGRAGGGLLPRLIAVTAGSGGDVFVLGSMGDLFRISNERDLQPITRLPLGQYHRISMIAAPDGVLVSGGFHIGTIFHVSGGGIVRTIAEHLADPQGIALDVDGYLYVAESAMHRVIRLRFP